MSGVHEIDLNLLVALDAMLRTQSVTRAARELGVTQSAMSHKLKRLRETFDDPLFVSGRHGLTPTPRAGALEEPLRRALHDLSAAVRVGEPFDPRTAERTLSVAASDLMELALLPRILERLHALAPSMRVVVRKRDRSSVEALAAGELDFLIQPGEQSVPGLDIEERSGVRRRHLSDEGFRVVVRADHPRLSTGRLTLKRFLAEDHVLVSPGGGERGVVDLVLARENRSRRIALRVPHFIGAPFVVARTDLLLTCPIGLAKAAAELVPLRVMKPPIELPSTRIFAYWHERYQHDSAHRWLRQFITEIAGVRERGRR